MIKNILLMIILPIFIISCGSDKKAPSHEELANHFVEALNMDAGYNVSIVKLDTKQPGFIVVQDTVVDSYDAYDLRGYTKDTDIDAYLEQTYNFDNFELNFSIEQTKNFYNSHDHDFYLPLNRYEGYDPVKGYFQVITTPIYISESGVTFSKQTMSPADLVKVEAIIAAKK